MELVGEISVIELRRNRKRKQVVVNKKTLIYVIFQISILSIILLIPVFAHSLLAYTSTLLSLCTLFLFGGTIVYLAIRLVTVVSDCFGSGKHAAEGIASDSRPLKNPLWSDLGGVAIVLMWAIILKLFHPFISALVWWQGYKLMGGKGFSLGTIEGTVTVVESFTYFSMVVILLLLSRSYWNYYGKGSR